MRQNLIYAIRGLLKTPSFTLAALLCLALGIGATTAIFSIVNAVVLRPLPYKNSKQLVRLYTEFPSQDGNGLHKFWFSEPEVFAIKGLRSLDDVGAWAIASANLSGTTQPVRITTAYVNAPALKLLEVKPVMGSLITPEEDKPGAMPVLVLSHSLWKSAFASDPNVIGRETYLNSAKARIIGVMPEDFSFPPGETDPPQAWSALQLNPLSTTFANHNYSVMGRLRNGISLAQARDEINRRVAQLGEAESAKNHVLSLKDHPASVYSFYDEVVGSIRPAMTMLLASVVLVLLIACVNVANLLLARSEARNREIAVRRAIGASDRHLLIQFVTEGLLLSIVGAAIGLAVAYGALHLIALTGAGNIPRASEINVDWRVLLFALLTSCTTGILFGLAPLVHTSAIRVFETLKNTSTRTSGTTASNRFRRLLVIGEMAMAFLLLSAAGLMIQGFWKLQQVSPGFRPDHLLTLSVSLPDKTYKDGAARVQFWTRLQQDLAQVPGITSATMMSGLPPIRPVNEDTTEFEGRVRTARTDNSNIAYYQMAGDDFFKTLGARLVEGRFLEPRDGQPSSLAVAVNQAAAQRFWPHESPIGRRLRPIGSQPWYTVVGVVANIKNRGLDKTADTEAFFPYRAQLFGGSNLQNPEVVIRTVNDPLSVSAAVRRTVAELDPSLPLAHISTMENVIAASSSRPRFLTLVLSMFSIIALGLAAIGIYGVISYSVEQRTPEFGIKMALGARPSGLLLDVLRQGLVLSVLGMVAGALVASLVTRALQGLVYGLGSNDYVSLITTAAVLTTATLLACAIPALRAMRLDPVTALRYE